MATLTVGAGGYSTIQAAVDAAASGDTIVVQAGTYVEQVVVDHKDNLTIRAETGAQVWIQAPADLVETARSSSDREIHGIITVKNSLNVTINNIDVDGHGAGNTVDEGGGAGQANFYGVFFRNSSGTLLDVDIKGVRDPYPGGTTPGGQPIVDGVQRGVGLVVDNDSLLAFTMTGGSISDFQKQGATFVRADLSITGVTVTGGGAQPIIAQNGFSVNRSTGNISGNTITGIGYTGPADAYSGVILSSSNTNLTINNNILSGSNDASNAAKVVGIWVYQNGPATSGGEISGNTVSYTDVGIYVNDVVSPTAPYIHGNSVPQIDLTDPYAAGVHLEQNLTVTTPFIVEGSQVHDELVGAKGADVFSAFAGADILKGNEGDDILDGGAGDDLIDGGAGLDTASYASSGARVEVDLALPEAQNTLGAGTDTLIGIENLAGSDYADRLLGDGSVNVLSGGGGDDFLDGRGGADTMSGGLGNDQFRVDNPSDRVIEALGGGFDRIYTSVSYALEAGSEVELLATTDSGSGVPVTLTGNDLVQTVIGTEGDDSLYGLAGDDYLRGLGGSDVIDGGTGADVMEGGAGNDIYFVDNAGDVIREDAGGGFDFLYTSTSYALGIAAQVEILATTNSGGTGAIDLSGSARDNTIIGNDGVNILNGGGGNDYLQGLGGNDVIFGGAGQDIIEGGAGADVFKFEYTSESTLDAPDSIRDFVSGSDKIDLSLVDSNTTIGGNQDFTFIGAASFSGHAGELRVEMVGSTAYITADTNGDGAADMLIIAYNSPQPLTGTDFVL